MSAQFSSFHLVPNDHASVGYGRRVKLWEGEVKTGVMRVLCLDGRTSHDGTEWNKAIPNPDPTVVYKHADGVVNCGYIGVWGSGPIPATLEDDYAPCSILTLPRDQWLIRYPLPGYTASGSTWEEVGETREIYLPQGSNEVWAWYSVLAMSTQVNDGELVSRQGYGKLHYELNYVSSLSLNYRGYQSNLPAYSGAYLIAPRVELEIQNIDLFGMDQFSLPLNCVLCNQSPPPPHTDFGEHIIDSRNPSFTTLVPSLPAGMYKLKYMSGAILGSSDTKWNKMQAGPYSNGRPSISPTHTVWFQMADNEDDMYYFQDPAFTTNGYNTAPDAEAAALYTSIVFQHNGGGIKARYDERHGEHNNCLGTITTQLTAYDPAIPPVLGDGAWNIIYSSLPTKPEWPYVIPSTRRLAAPVIVNLSPGVHILRYTLDMPQPSKAWYQDYYMRVWNTPPRLSPMAFVGEEMKDVPEEYRLILENGVTDRTKNSLFPVKPKRLYMPNAPWFATNQQGTPPIQKPKYAGNQPERRDGPGDKLKPKHLGPHEKF